MRLFSRHRGFLHDAFHHLHIPHRHRDAFRRRFLLSILAITGLIISLSVLKLSLDVRDKAQKEQLGQPQTVVLEFEKDPATDQITLINSHHTPGKPPQTTQAIKTPELLQLKHPSLGQQTIPLFFYDTIQGESLTLTQPNTPAADPRLKLDRPKAITAVEIYPETSLEVSNNHGQAKKIDRTQLPFTSSTLTALTTTVLADNNKNKLDITLIGSHFNSFEEFEPIAVAISQFIESVPPFSDYSRAIHFRSIIASQDLNCHFIAQNSRLIICNNALVLAEASQVPTDTIIVIENTQTYGGSAIIGGNIAITYADVNSLAKQVAVHEFGHSFGSLMDEYGYGYVDYGTPYSLNCSRDNTCPVWNGIPTTGCFQTCSATNFYRSTENGSLMRSLTPLGGVTFGFVDEELIRRRLESYDITPNHQVALPSWWSCDTNADSIFDVQDLTFFLPRFSTLHLTTDCRHNLTTDIFDINHLIKNMNLSVL